MTSVISSSSPQRRSRRASASNVATRPSVPPASRTGARHVGRPVRPTANSIARIDRLREVAVHAGGQAALAIAGHRVRGHGHDADVAAGRRARARESRRSPRGRPSPASAGPSARGRTSRCSSRASASRPSCATVTWWPRRVSRPDRDPLVDHVVLDEQDADARTAGAHRQRAGRSAARRRRGRPPAWRRARARWRVEQIGERRPAWSGRRRCRARRSATGRRSRPTRSAS